MPPQFAALGDSECLEVRGTDSAAFLQGQLSRAVADLDPDEAPLAGWADARGRVRALLRVCRLADRWLLVTPRDGAEALATKLRMFVLRSKVTIAPAADVAVAAVLGDATEWLAHHGVAGDAAPNRLVRRDDLTFVRVSSSYWQIVGARRAVTALGKELPPATEATAELAEIALGIPAITPSIAERYVAQMLNLDVLDAVAFDKGCYPGQEIIARVHNLGGVKRRAHRYAADRAPPPIGAAVLAGDAAVGEVVRSAPSTSGCELLAVVDHTATTSTLRCDGVELRELPLPFVVPRD
jgi:folate-binding protein YgfZ